MNLQSESKINEIKGGLYIVATPIGNLGDITLRALEIIKNSDLILCEDTRVSKKLLSKFEISKKLVSNHKFNENKNLNFILEHLENIKIISIISVVPSLLISEHSLQLSERIQFTVETKSSISRVLSLLISPLVSEHSIQSEVSWYPI